MKTVTLDHLAQWSQLQGAAEDCMEVQEQGKNLVSSKYSALCSSGAFGPNAALHV